MNLRWCFIFSLVLAGGLFSPPLRADVAPAADNPYTPIVHRNIFGLVPIPVHNPADDVAVTPPPKITPNGIMRLFGNLQVIFKVAVPAQAGQPAKDESYVLGEGERQNDITVQKIDEASATITFDNHGTIQSLPLVASTAAPGAGPGGPPPSAGMIPPPPLPSGLAPAGGASSGPIGFGGRFGRNRNIPGAGNPSPNPNAGASPFGGMNAAPQNNNSQTETITPEEQIINMEAQRAKFLDEGNPAAAIIPPTELTSQITGEENPSSPPGLGSAGSSAGLLKRRLGSPPVPGQ